jgi:hypothetical protein
MNAPRLLIDALAETLGQGRTLVASLGSPAYTRKIPEAFDASIGGHYRHCLDHFEGLLSGIASGELDYDCRRRDPRIEEDPAFAREATSRLLASVRALEESVLDRPLRVRARVSLTDLGPSGAASTAGREVMYAIAHAVHHYALIGVIASLQGLALPAGFGVAPSTLHHRAGTG